MASKIGFDLYTRSTCTRVYTVFEDFHSSKREKFTHFIIVKSDLIPVVSLYGELNYSSSPRNLCKPNLKVYSTQNTVEILCGAELAKMMKIQLC